MRSTRIGVVGYGKIARDQHLPALAADPAFDLVAVTEGPHPAPDGVRVYPTLDAMIAGEPRLEAVSLCTPPKGRHALARRALEHNLHVMLEKPPGESMSEVEPLIDAARARGVALFGAWHSREAPAVEPARAWLSQAVIRDTRIDWKEDVRRWHPGQAWIWEPGGFGVFDPGINALSIVTWIMPREIKLEAAVLSYPENRAMPIAAALSMTDSGGTPISADFDWRQAGTQTWDIVVSTDRGRLRLSDGGAGLSIDDRSVPVPSAAEYPNLYRRFAGLVESRSVDVDLRPLRLVVEAFTRGRRTAVAAFDD